MMDKSNKNVILKIIGLAVMVFLLVYMGSIIFGNDDYPDESLESIIKDIDVKTVPHQMGMVDIQPPDLKNILARYLQIPAAGEQQHTQLHRNIFLNGKSWQRY